MLGVYRVGLTLPYIKIISTLIPAPREGIAHSIRLQRKKSLFCHRKPWAYHPLGHAELPLLKSALSPTFLEVLLVQDTPPFSMSNGIFASRRNFSIAFAVRVS
jgi:hypothetical protein